MVIFSTIGVFVSPLSAPSSLIAFFRAFFGTLVTFLVIALTGRRFNKKLFWQNARYLIPSGIALGANWVLLFEGYKLTGVATATLTYYLAPAFVILASPFVLKERISVKKVICATVALLGMIPVSDVLNPDSRVNFKGILLSLAAALLYASIVLLNKKVKKLSGIETTATQLGISAVVVGFYVFVAVPHTELILDLKTLGILVLLGVVHTGLAYLLYFSSVRHISAQTAALLSYIDPAGALLLSYTVLGEKFSLSGFFGIVLILVSLIVSEISFKKK